MGWADGESTRYVMQPSVNSVSVVVPSWSWDRRDQLERCLRAIERQTLAPAETIVVIDHNPRLLEWTRESFPGIEVIANRHERGRGRRPQQRGRGRAGRGRRADRRRHRGGADLDRATRVLLRGPRRGRRHRRAPARLVRARAGLVPVGVLLGVRLQLHRAADRGRAGSQPDRRQHGGPHRAAAGDRRIQGGRRPARDLLPRRRHRRRPCFGGHRARQFGSGSGGPR